MGFKMETVRDNVALYAAIKTFHGKGHDMWSAVAALTLMIMPDEGSDNDVKHDFSIQYKLDVPSDALKTVLTRLSRQGEIEYSHGAIKITESGKTRRATLEKSVKAIRREYTQLNESFKLHLKNKHVKVEGDSSKVLLDFIDDNIGFASEVVASKKKAKQGNAVPSSIVADYIVSIESANPALFEILQNVFFGRLYMTLIKTRTEIDKNAKFSRLTVYFDTNVILDALNLHGGERHQSATEMLDVFKEFKDGIRLAIYDETYEETVNLLRSYTSQNRSFAQHIKVDHPLYELKARNIDRQDIILIIENLESKLALLGISIDTLPALDEEKYQDTRSNISKVVDEIEGQKSSGALNHDAKIIEAIKAIRKNNRVKTDLLEKTRAIFLTSDQSLYYYSKRYAESSNNFPLAIRPVEIISLLWIKAIGSEGKFSGNLLRHAVMGYARERLISGQLWETFMNRLAEAQSKGVITEEDIGVILAADETEKLLSSNKANILDEIVNPDYIGKLRTEHADLIMENTTRNQEIEQLRKQVNHTQKEVKNEYKTRLGFEEKVVRLNQSIQKYSHGIALVTVNICSLLLWLALGGGIYLLLNKFGLDTIANGLAILMFLVSVFFYLMGKKIEIGQSIISRRNKVVKSLEDKITALTINRLIPDDAAD